MPQGVVLPAQRTCLGPGEALLGVHRVLSEGPEWKGTLRDLETSLRAGGLRCVLAPCSVPGSPSSLCPLPLVRRVPSRNEPAASSHSGKGWRQFTEMTRDQLGHLSPLEGSSSSPAWLPRGPRVVWTSQVARESRAWGVVTLACPWLSHSSCAEPPREVLGRSPSATVRSPSQLAQGQC